MLKNVGRWDQAARFILGILFILMVLFHLVVGRPGLFLAALGIYLLFTSLLQHCPLYQQLGFSTKKFNGGT
ncbi:MAG: DUF2892 domain-containing protein [Candidatus Syntrophonatronum acetioxidans]|uniref:DUF2892 domain-containing protein n=1 Tax=Candidatus Syntrophonatronum acetioxidans TaxID=1795816 RepID=A0A424YEU1_9FIRM|nr:MAG: DUF2892 domain-containing protein [Candidatus Syntrophonatronum acetioxidans]